MSNVNKTFIVIHDIPHKGSHITTHSNEEEVIKYVKEKLDISPGHDFTIYEVIREINVYDLLKGE